MNVDIANSADLAKNVIANLILRRSFFPPARLIVDAHLKLARPFGVRATRRGCPRDAPTRRLNFDPAIANSLLRKTNGPNVDAESKRRFDSDQGQVVIIRSSLRLIRMMNFDGFGFDGLAVTFVFVAEKDDDVAVFDFEAFRLADFGQRALNDDAAETVSGG